VLPLSAETTPEKPAIAIAISAKTSSVPATCIYAAQRLASAVSKARSGLLTRLHAFVMFRIEQHLQTQASSLYYHILP